MDTGTPQPPTSVTRDHWLRALSQYVSAETEPPVRRRSRRYAAFGVVRLSCWQDGAPLVTTVSATQISADGLMLRSHRLLPVGIRVEMEVTLDSDPIQLAGRVRHVTQTVGSYKIGVELEFPEDQ